MRIGDHQIGSSSAPYIIAEIGVNHDGSAARARELVAAAAAAGADAVKFQYFTVERLLSGAARLVGYQRQSGANDVFAMLADLELPLDELATLADFARAQTLDPIVTIFSFEHALDLRPMPWAAYKIASPDIVNRPLIDAVCANGKPVILSTGAATAHEVCQAASWITEQDFALMQCVSAYPTPRNSAHLAAIGTLRDLVDVPVGYSDHTTDEQTGGLAVAAGAAFLEKHLTYDRSANGPDHAMSLDRGQFDRYVQFARLAAEMLGESRKIPHEIESDVRQASRQSIVAARRLRAGQVVRADDLTVKRPGNGLPSAHLRDLVGQTLAADAEADTALTASHFMADSDAKRMVRIARTADAA